MSDCWDCVHLEKRCGGFQYCLLNGGRRNVDANRDRCKDYEIINKMEVINPFKNSLLMDLMIHKIPITMYLVENNKIAYSVPGFYKCNTVNLIQKDDKFWYVHQRYNQIDIIECLYDLASINKRWWERSKDRYEEWIAPDPCWVDVLLEFGFIKKEVKEVVNYI